MRRARARLSFSSTSRRFSCCRPSRRLHRMNPAGGAGVHGGSPAAAHAASINAGGGGGAGQAAPLAQAQAMQPLPSQGMQPAAAAPPAMPPPASFEPPFAGDPNFARDPEAEAAADEARAAFLTASTSTQEEKEQRLKAAQTAELAVAQLCAKITRTSTARTYPERTIEVPVRRAARASQFLLLLLLLLIPIPSLRAADSAACLPRV